MKEPYFYGLNLSKRIMKNSLSNKIFATGVVFVIIIVFSFLYLNREQPLTQSFSTQAHLTTSEFISLFDNKNSLHARRYVDKAIEIKGPLKKITHREGKYTLFLKSDEKGRYIMCEMQEDQLQKVKAINTDEIITVKGIFKGVLLDAILLNCIIIDSDL